MGSESMKLPIIDFRNLKQGTLGWETVKKQVGDALEEYGCFEALFNTNHQHLQKSVFDGLELLFDLPLETKERNRTSMFSRGYIQTPDFEGMGIEDILHPGKIESFVNLLWSDEGNPLFRGNLESYLKQLSELDKIVRRIVLESLGVEKYMDEHLESTNYVSRLFKYKGLLSDETKTVLSTHTDMNVVTILSQNEVNGLEVLTKDENQWINVELSQDSLIVMVGDAFHAWTNGRVYPAHHRVRMTGEKDRYSIGLFSVPMKGYIIKAPEEMVDEEHPLLFKPYDHFEFMKFCFSRDGSYRSPAALKAFCGA